MDSDDEITPDCIQKLYDEMKRSNVDLVIGSMTTSVSDTVSAHPENEIIVERKQEQMVNIFSIVYTWNKLYKISFLRDNNIRCVPYHTVEDPYFIFQVAVKAKSYSIIPDITYLYHWRSDSNSGGVWSEKLFKQFPQIFSDQLEVLRNEIFDAVLRRKYKKKLFWSRVTISRFALKSPAYARPYISQYLSSFYLNDRDTFHDGILFLGYIVSKLPLAGKILFLKCHLLFYK
jgi:hypothetical protein